MTDILGLLCILYIPYTLSRTSIVIFITLIMLGMIHPNTSVCLFVCFVALRPKSTAMVMAGRTVHLTTLFPGQA